MNIGSDYMQDVLKCMMDEQVLRHLEKVELFEDWFSVIQSVFEGKVSIFNICEKKRLICIGIL